jgi:hypothetical protein
MIRRTLNFGLQTDLKQLVGRKLWLAMFVAMVLFSIIVVSATELASAPATGDPFPENRIVIMNKTWMTRDSLIYALDKMKQAFNNLPLNDTKEALLTYSTSSPTPGLFNNVPYNGQMETQLERQNVIFILERIKDLYDAYDHLQHEEFASALNLLKRWESLSNYEAQYAAELYKNDGSYSRNFPGTKYLGYRLAFWDGTDTSIELARWGHWSGEHENYWKKSPPPAYKGPYLAGAIGLYKCDSESFRSFNLHILYAEIYTALGAYDEAELEYYQIMGGIFGDPCAKPTPADIIEGVSSGIKLESSQQKYTTIRRAFNFLAWGDRHFKRAHGLLGSDKQANLDEAKKKYEAALCLFPDTYIAMQIDQKMKALDDIEAKTLQTLGTPNVMVQQEQLAVQAKEGSSVPTFEGYVITPTPSIPTFTAYVIQENPLIIEIVSHAKMQLMKIAHGNNYLGYPDGYVPEQRYKFLFSHANEYADMTVQTEARYMQFKKEAEDQEYQSRQLEQNAQITLYQEQIAQTRRQNANDRSKQADLKMKQIDEKITEIKSSGFWKFFAGSLSMMAGILATPVTGGASAAAGVLAYTASTTGAIGQAISNNHEIAALQYEKQAVAVDKVIAAREGVIADLEGTIAQMQGLFIRDNLQYLSLKELNQDLYYALAKTLKRVKQAYLDAGIRMGYLAERALAFEMGKLAVDENGKRGLQFIKFDYERSDLKNLLAGDFLKQDLVMMEYNRALELKQRNHVKHVISLRERYPIEFSNFIESGRMDFVTRLYEFDKAYPGTYQRHLRRVEVVIQGLVGPEGFKGSLTNFGSFIVRNKQKTLNASRLIPTDTELGNAYNDLKSKGLSALSVGGVDAYQLPPARLVLSKYDIRQDGIIFPADAEVRDTFEDFGVSGLWRLELPKNINDVDYRTIADVQLILYFDAYYDPDLEKKVAGYYDSATKTWVQGLVQKYEEELTGGKDLDQIAMFSLRQHFPDEFFSISGGQVDIELLNGDFPYYMDEKRVKKIIVRAVKQDGSGLDGLSIEVSKVKGTLSPLSGITNSKGYAVDTKGYMDPEKSAELPDPEPIVGTWQINFKDTSMLKDLDDVLVFFMYEYKEKKGSFGI